MTNPRIRYVVFGVLALAIVSQIGVAAILTSATTTPTDAQSAFGNDRLEAETSRYPSLSTTTTYASAETVGTFTVESLERAFVQAIQTLDGPGLLVLAGTIRNGNDDPLDNEVRAAIYDVVSENSGVRLTRLADELDVGTSTVRYHVRVLDDAGKVEAETIWGRRWVSVPTVERTDLVLTAALNEEALTSVFEVLTDLGPASVSELAATLDRAPSTVSHHLQRLASEGLVERKRDGSAVRTSLTDEIKERLDQEM